MVERVVSEALNVLRKVGVFVEHEEGLALLGDAGAQVDRGAQRAFLSEDLVWRCVRSAPRQVTVFSQDGKPALNLEGLNVYFDPGSAAIKILDAETGQVRAPITEDLIAFARVTDELAHMHAQSTALVPTDVPQAIADRYRLFLVLLHSRKPVVTGTFTREGFAIMEEMLLAVSGSAERLRQFPTAIFDACPSPPLKWSNLTAQSLLDCARSGLPAELVSVPLLGATAPVTLAGALVQHTAENLSGLVLHQLAGAGSPVIYGGSPALFDMRHGTTALGAAETALLVCASAQIGRFFGLPTHGYLGLSDAKIVDTQTGIESGLGITMAALAGVNVVSGAGMLEFESCQSLEKLVLDNEICGMAERLARGVAARGPILAEDLQGDLSRGDHFFTSPATLRWHREEMAYPGAVMDRRPRDAWLQGGRTSALERAALWVREILEKPHSPVLPESTQKDLLEIMAKDGRRQGLEKLPKWAEPRP
jgi:trimethylamine--corrinoid protein Co-methyltransferase